MEGAFLPVTFARGWWPEEPGNVKELEPRLLGLQCLSVVIRWLSGPLVGICLPLWVLGLVWHLARFRHSDAF